MNVATVGDMHPSRPKAAERAKHDPACPHCGASSTPDHELVIKRGAVTVAFDPALVKWRDHVVPLSATEAYVYAAIFRRGRLTYPEVDEAIAECGSRPATRSLLLGHIRSKFLRMGGCDPFERVGQNTIRLCVDADVEGRVAPVIGLEMPRYVTASRSAAGTGDLAHAR